MTEFRKIPEKTRDIEDEKSRGQQDARASREAIQLGSGKSAKELKDEALANEAHRTEKFRDHFEGLAIVSLYLVWLAITAVGLIWLYHLVAPPCWPRLPDDQVRNIQAIVTGGVIAGIAGGHMKKRLN